MAPLHKALIHRSELDFIGRCVLEYPTIETGGDLFGFWSNEGNAVIHYVIGPGQRTSRSETSFYQDIGYLKECGRVLNGRFGLEHIGAWHSHHRMSLYQPSLGDVHTMQNALKTKNPSRFIISICNIEKENSVSIGCFIFTANDHEPYGDCEWKILEGKSPLRETLLRDQSDLFRSPSERNVVLNIRAGEVPPSTGMRGTSEKPEFPEGSFWNARDGKDYLKWAFEELKRKDQFFDVEILQLDDRRIVLSLKCDNWSFQIRFPNDFPKGEIEVIGKEAEILERNRREHKVQPRKLARELLDILKLIDKRTDINIQYR